MPKLETISDEMRQEAVKFLKRKRNQPRTKKTRAALKMFSNGENIMAAFQDDDPWTSCAIGLEGELMAMGSSKRCTYAKDSDKPNSTTGQGIAWARAVWNFRNTL